MSTTIERLLILQDRDRKLGQLLREKADVPARIKQIEDRLSAHQQSLHAAQEEVKKNTAGMKQIEGEIEARKQKIAKYREQQFQIKSNVEYKALEHEISVVQDEIHGLEDDEIALMEGGDKIRSLIGDREGDLKQEQKRVLEDQQVLKKRLEQIEAEIHDVQVDRDALAKDCDASSLQLYDRIMKRLGDYAVVRIENGSCGGCHMKLTPQLVHDTRKGLNLVQCNYCSRILYWQP